MRAPLLEDIAERLVDRRSVGVRSCSGPSPPSRRPRCATATSSRRATTPSSTSFARSTTNCGAFLVELEARERERTGIANLKVEYNRVHGFYIEVTNAHAASVPDDYRRRQTLKNAERYITPELKAFEDKALSAQERALARERVLYDALLTELAAAMPALQRAARRWRRSTFSRRTPLRRQRGAGLSPRSPIRRDSSIRGGQHPVVDAQVEHFIPNDVTLGPDRRLLIVTGPNMGGKSTYMRQTAVIALLAYCGLFVPASEASHRPARRDLHPHRRGRRSRRRPIDLHGRDDRGGVHPQSRDADRAWS